MKKLIEIQAELKAPKSQRNDFGGYDYRSCEDILGAVKPLLGEATLTLSDEVVAVGDRVYVCATATLTHEGERVEVRGWAREAVNRKGMDDSQITGAASSYARKYALNGLFCIDDSKDADATNDHGNPAADKSSLKAITDKQIKDSQGFFKSFEASDDDVMATVDKFSGGRVRILDGMMQNEAACMLAALKRKHVKEFSLVEEA